MTASNLANKYEMCIPFVQNIMVRIEDVLLL